MVETHFWKAVNGVYEGKSSAVFPIFYLIHELLPVIGLSPIKSDTPTVSCNDIVEQAVDK